MTQDKPFSKPFDRQLFNQNDPCAKLFAIQFAMTNYGVTLAENPVRYGIDLYVLGDDSRPTQLVEVERRPGWTAEEFPYKSITIPWRKQKFAVLDRAVYVVVNRDCDRLLSLSMEDVREAPVIEKVTSYSKGQLEKFYEVDLRLARFGEIKGLRRDHEE